MCGKHYSCPRLVLLKCTLCPFPRPQDLPLLVQTWRYNIQNPITDDISPKFLNFWQCCVEGYGKGVALYLAAGQNVDEVFHLRRNSEAHTALAFASLHGKANICKVSCGIILVLLPAYVCIRHLLLHPPFCSKMLLDAYAATESADVHGRSALHLAASKGHVAVLEVLTAVPKCCLYAEDSHGNTALHLAAR